MNAPLIVATRNAHKLREISEILGVPVQDVTAVGNPPEVEETGLTFAANAELKALAISQLTDRWVLADDSGLEVDALGGAPGVRSARFAGEGASDADNRNALRDRLLASGVLEPWTARFRCVLALARNGRVEALFEGACEGRIIPDECGERGFGYDSLFVPSGYEETFAELPSETKHSLSHRGLALRRLAASGALVGYRVDSPRP